MEKKEKTFKWKQYCTTSIAHTTTVVARHRHNDHDFDAFDADGDVHQNMYPFETTKNEQNPLPVLYKYIWRYAPSNRYSILIIHPREVDRVACERNRFSCRNFLEIFVLFVVWRNIFRTKMPGRPLWQVRNCILKHLSFISSESFDCCELSRWWSVFCANFCCCCCDEQKKHENCISCVACQNVENIKKIKRRQRWYPIHLKIYKISPFSTVIYRVKLIHLLCQSIRHKLSWQCIPRRNISKSVRLKESDESFDLIDICSLCHTEIDSSVVVRCFYAATHPKKFGELAWVCDIELFFPVWLAERK